jgi:hypothetical protein
MNAEWVFMKIRIPPNENYATDGYYTVADRSAEEAISQLFGRLKRRIGSDEALGMSLYGNNNREILNHIKKNLEKAKTDSTDMRGYNCILHQATFIAPESLDTSVFFTCDDPYCVS